MANGATTKPATTVDVKIILKPGYLVFGLAIIAIILLAIFGIGSIVSNAIPTATGVGIFAALYVLAQFIERCLEPFSNSDRLGGHDDPSIPGQKTARLISLWLIASGIGIFLCYISVGFFQLMGVSFLSGYLVPGHFLDAIVSGIVVGSGTKPLHDLINLIDKNG